MKLEVRAKINWTLDIVGQRPDGYHLMEMLMQPITLCDLITLEEAEEITLEVTGGREIPADPTNLAWRAAEALRQATGCRKGARICVEKKIPSQAGLGGGSADAAGVLVGLNRLWGTCLPQEELERIGLTLGADVPFCLRGHLCRVTGIGEVLEPLEDPAVYPLLIVQPEAGLSTGAVFRAYHTAKQVRHPALPHAAGRIIRGERLSRTDLGNVMQEVSAAMCPEIIGAVEALEQAGAMCAQMSGSGSAVFGVFRDEESARAARPVLAAKFGRAFLCHTCTDSIRYFGTEE